MIIKKELESTLSFITLIFLSYFILETISPKYFNFNSGLIIFLMISLLIGYIFENNTKLLMVMTFIIGNLSYLSIIALLFLINPDGSGSRETTASMVVIFLFFAFIIVTSLFLSIALTIIVYIPIQLGLYIKKNTRQFIKRQPKFTNEIFDLK